MSKTALVRRLGLVAFVWYILSPQVWAQYSTPRPDLELLDLYLDRADACSSRAEWDELSLAGSGAVMARWDSEALVLMEAGMDCGALREAASAEVRESIEERLSAWLVDQFFGNLEPADIAGIASDVKESRIHGVFEVDDAGRIALDGTGSPLRRDLEGDEAFAQELDDWINSMDALKEDTLSEWHLGATAAYSELLSSLSPEQRTSLEASGTVRLSSLRESQQRQIDALMRIEESNYRYLRLNDRYSLRIKSDSLSAGALAESLIAETQSKTDLALAELSSGLDLEAGEILLDGDLIDGDDWQERFREELDKGLDLWNGASEELLMRRVEWEQRACENLAAGIDSWDAARLALQERQREWLSDFREVRERGEAMYNREFAELERARELALAELDASILASEGSLSERAEATVDMLAQSIDMMKTARESMGYWISRIPGNETFKVDSISWDADEMRDFLEEQRPAGDDDSPAAVAYEQASYWLNNVYVSYSVLAKDLNDELARTWGLVVFGDEEAGPGSSRDPIEVLNSSGWESVCLDSWQVELLKARAVKTYWERELEVAQAVHEYSIDDTYTRPSEEDTLVEYERTLTDYRAALAEYQEAVAALEEINDALMENKVRMADIRERLEAANRELTSAKDEYSRLLVMAELNTADYYTGRFREYYEQLLNMQGLLPGEESALDDALAKLAAVSPDSEAEVFLESTSRAAYALIHGGDTENGSRIGIVEMRSRLDARSSFTISPEDLVDISAFKKCIEGSLYLRPGDGWHTALIEAFEETLETPVQTERLTCLLDAAARTLAMESRGDLERSMACLRLLLAGTPQDACNAGAELANTVLPDYEICGSCEEAISLLERAEESAVTSLLQQRLDLELAALNRFIDADCSMEAPADYESPEDTLAWVFGELSIERGISDVEVYARGCIASLTALSGALDGIEGSLDGRSDALRSLASSDPLIGIYLDGGSVFSDEFVDYTRSRLAFFGKACAVTGSSGEFKSYIDLSPGLREGLRDEASDSVLDWICGNGLGSLDGTMLRLADPVALWDGFSPDSLEAVLGRIDSLESGMESLMKNEAIPEYLRTAVADWLYEVSSLFALRGLRAFGAEAAANRLDGLAAIAAASNEVLKACNESAALAANGTARFEIRAASLLGLMESGMILPADIRDGTLNVLGDSFARYREQVGDGEDSSRHFNDWLDDIGAGPGSSANETLRGFESTIISLAEASIERGLALIADESAEDACVVVKIKILDGGFTSADLTGLDAETAQEINRFAAVVNAVRDYHACLDGDFLLYVTSCPRLADESQRIDALGLFMTGSFDDPVFSRGYGNIAAYLDDRCTRFGDLGFNAYSAYLGNDISDYCAGLGTISRSDERRRNWTTECIRLSTDAIGSYREYLDDTTIILDEPNGIGWDDVAYGESREVDRLSVDTDGSLAHGTDANLNDSLEQASRVVDSGSALEAMFTAWTTDDGSDPLLEYLDENAALAGFDPFAEFETGLFDAFAIREADYSVQRDYRSAQEGYASILARHEGLVDELRRNGNAIATYRDSHDDLAIGLTEDTKAEIRRLEENRDALEEEWDICINGVDSEVQYDGYAGAGYIQLDDEYQDRFEEAQAAFVNLEESKQEYRIARAVRDYAATPYLFDNPDDLEDTRRSELRAGAALSALESVYEQRINGSGFTETDSIYLGFKEEYERVYRSRLAVMQSMEVLDGETMLAREDYNLARREYRETLADLCTINLSESDEDDGKEAVISERVESLSKERMGILKELRISSEGAISFGGDGEFSVGDIVRYFKIPEDGTQSGFEEDLVEWINSCGDSDCIAGWIDALTWEELRFAGCLNMQDYLALYPPIEKIDRGYGYITPESQLEIDTRYDLYLNEIAMPTILEAYKGTSEDQSIRKAIHLMRSQKYRTMTKLIGDCEERYKEHANDKGYDFFKLICLLDAVDLGNYRSGSWLNSNFAYNYYEYAETKCKRYERKAIMPWGSSEWGDAEKEAGIQKDLAKSRMDDNQQGLLSARTSIAGRLAAVAEKKSVLDILSPDLGDESVTALHAVDALIAAFSRSGCDYLSDLFRTAEIEGVASSDARAALLDLLEGSDEGSGMVADSVIEYLEAVSLSYDDMCVSISSELEEYLYAGGQGSDIQGLSTVQAELEEAYRTVCADFMDSGNLSGLQNAIQSAFANPVFEQGDDYMLTYDLFSGILDDLASEHTGIRIVGQNETMDTMRLMIERMNAVKLSQIKNVREHDWEIRRMELGRAMDAFGGQLDEILTRGTSEWEKAARLLSEKSLLWGKSFQADYQSKQEEWDLRYLDLVELKDEWAVDITAKAVEIGNRRVLGEIGDEARDKIAASGSFIVSDLIEAPNTQALLLDVLDGEYMSGLLHAATNGNREIGKIGHVAFQALKQRDYTSGDLLNRIRRYHSEDDDELQARLAFIQYDQAVQTLADAHEGVEDSLEDANRNTWVGFRNMLIQDGFVQKGQNFIKETIVGATLWESLYEDHVIKGYEYFAVTIRDFTRDLLSPESINLSSIGAEGIQALLDKAMGAVSMEYERLFGKRDDEGNYADAVYTEQFVNGDGISGTRNITGNGYDEYLESIEGMSQERKADYDKKRRVVLGNVGAFTEWVGDAPVFCKDADPDRDIDDYQKNVLFKGSGQTERIMGMFLQHKMIEGTGKSQANQPFYNKKIWDDRGGGMEAPSIRSVTDIAVSIAVSVFSGPQTGMLLMAAFNMIDDAVFTVLDMANGVEMGDALEGFGKKAMISVASSAISVGVNGGCLAGGSKIAGLAQSSGLSESVIGAAVMKGTEIAATNCATSAIQAFSFKSAFSGRDCFDERGFSRGVTGNDAMARVASGVAGTFVRAGISEYTGRNDYSGYSRAHMEGISSVSSLAGGIASTAVSWGMTGNATVNLLNTSMLKGFGLTDRAGGAVNTGLLELRIGSGGARAAVGMNGTDMNVGMIASSMKGLGALYNNARIANYCTNNGIESGVAMRALYSYGDRSGKSLYNELVSGSASLGINGEIEGQACTITGSDGVRTIGLNTLGNDLISGINAAVVLQHEAYRDGLASADQNAETRMAVEGHTRMAARILDDGLYSEAIMSNASILADMAVYSGSPESFDSYVDEMYDSSGDYWRIKLDGSIVDDGTSYVSREIIDASGRLVAEKIEGSDFTGSRAAALAGIIGIDNVRGMLGGSPDSLSDVPAEVIASAVGCSIETAQRMRMNPSLAPTLMAAGSDTQTKILGEMLLYASGSSFDESSRRWSGGSVKIPGLGRNDSLGVVRHSDGSYEFFAAGMVWDRDEDAFDTWKDGQASADYDVRDNTDVSIWKRNLFTGTTETAELDGAWTSVDRMSGNIVTVNGHTYQGNTIVSEYFKMHLKDYTGSKDYGVERVGVLTDAILLNGDSLNKNGTTINDSIPWYMHPFSQNAGSEGCIGPLSEERFEGFWNNAKDPMSGSWYMNRLLDLFDHYSIYDGYEFSMRITGRIYPW